MAVSATTAAPPANPQVLSDTNSAKKKKLEKLSSPALPASSPTTRESTTVNGVAQCDSNESSHESSYVRELQKNIRNVNKKISNASRVDSVVAENPDMTLDELVAARKINADQKAQILKKPVLQATLAQLEDQIQQYSKFDAEIRVRSRAEKAAFEKAIKDQAAKDLEEAVAAARLEEREAASKNLEQNLLLLSQFLKLAAIRRAEEEVAELEESKALEGLLAQVYSGDANAVASMLCLINGSEATLRSVNGEELSITYVSLRAASVAQVSPTDPELLECDAIATEPPKYPSQNDTTITGLEVTEIGPIISSGAINGHIESAPPQPTLQSSRSSRTISNANGESSAKSPKRPSAAALTSTQIRGRRGGPRTSKKVRSRAEEHPENPVQSPSGPPGDGFQEIQRNRGGRGHRGGRGDGSRGRHRGEGQRGRGRGGSHRGARRAD